MAKKKKKQGGPLIDSDTSIESVIDLFSEEGVEVFIERKFPNKNAKYFYEDTEENELYIRESEEGANRVMLPIDDLDTMKWNYERMYREAAYMLERLRQRSNADRGLTPKKQHTGYVILAASEKKQYINYPPGERENIQYWEYTMQTPYDITIDKWSVGEKVRLDFRRTDPDKVTLTSAFGIQCRFEHLTMVEIVIGIRKLLYDATYNKELVDELHLLDDQEKEKWDSLRVAKFREKFYGGCIANLRLFISGSDGYWHIAFDYIGFYHSVPLEMAPARLLKRNKQ